MNNQHLIPTGASAPLWLQYALDELGTAEVPGRLHNPRILEYWQQVRVPFQDDETPWCAAYVGAMLEHAAVRSTRSAAARSYEHWGKRVDGLFGSIAVFWREPRVKGFGHVGFLVGKDAAGRLMILGGNQGDKVSIMPFDPARLLCTVWPEDRDTDGFASVNDLSLWTAQGPASTNEA